MATKCLARIFFDAPKASFASQVKIVCEMFTKDDSMRCHMIQKIVATCDAMRCDAMCWFSWDDMIFCNHLAKFVHPQRRFWKTEQKMNCGFSIDFSMVPSPVKRTSKMMFSSFVHSSKIQ